MDNAADIVDKSNHNCLLSLLLSNFEGDSSISNSASKAREEMKKYVAEPRCPMTSDQLGR